MRVALANEMKDQEFFFFSIYRTPLSNRKEMSSLRARFPYVSLFCTPPCQAFDLSCPCKKSPTLHEISNYLVRAQTQRAIIARVTQKLLAGGGFKKNASNALLQPRGAESLFAAMQNIPAEQPRGGVYNLYEALERHEMLQFWNMQGHTFMDVVALLAGIMPYDMDDDKSTGPYPTKQALATAVGVAARHLLECIPLTRRLEAAIANVVKVLDALQQRHGAGGAVDYGEGSQPMADALYALYDEMDTASPVYAIYARYLKECVAGDVQK